MRKFLSSAPLLLLFLAGSVYAESFHAVGWNVESGDNDRDTIAEQIAAFQGCDLFGLCEVREVNADTYAAAAAVGEGATFAHVVSRTGRADRMVIVFNTDKFERLETIELDGSVSGVPDLSFGNRVRAPLAGCWSSEFGGILFVVVTTLPMAR